MDARARAHTRRHLHQSRVEYVDPAMMRSVLHAARKTGKHARDASMFAWSMHACRRGGRSTEEGHRGGVLRRRSGWEREARAHATRAGPRKQLSYTLSSQIVGVRASASWNAAAHLLRASHLSTA